MEYTSVKQMGQMNIFQEKNNSMLIRLFLLIPTEQFVFPFLNDNEIFPDASKNTMYILTK